MIFSYFLPTVYPILHLNVQRILDIQSALGLFSKRDENHKL